MHIIEMRDNFVVKRTRHEMRICLYSRCSEALARRYHFASIAASNSYGITKIIAMARPEERGGTRVIINSSN